MEETKQFTITAIVSEDGIQFMHENDGFEPFELIGVLTHSLDLAKKKIEKNSYNRLEKEMD